MKVLMGLVVALLATQTAALAAEDRLVAIVGDYGMQTCVPFDGEMDSYGRCGRDSVPRVLQKTLRQQRRSSPWRSAKVVSLTDAFLGAKKWLVPMVGSECPSSLIEDPRFPFSGLRKQACGTGASLTDSISAYLGRTPDYVLINFNKDDPSVTPTEEVDAIEEIAQALQAGGATVLVSTPLLENSSTDTFAWQQAVAQELRLRGLVNGPDFSSTLLPRYHIRYLSPEGSVGAVMLWWGVLNPQIFQ